VRRVPHPDAPDLSELVGDVVAFRRDVVFRRPQVSRVTDLVRFGDVEVLWHDLLLRGTRHPAFRVVRAGRTVAGHDVTRRVGIGNHDLSDVVSANQVIDRYRRGDTVVLQGLHHTSPHLARLANNVALALDHPVQVNAYLSPPSARGLDLHFDFHDVFIVQLGGSKRCSSLDGARDLAPATCDATAAASCTVTRITEDGVHSGSVGVADDGRRPRCARPR
jgi:bifunctional lysine-specific demethylase and histidyl-hydroxylase NO66